MHIYFNPLDTACKNVIGGVRQGELIEFNVFCLKNGTPDAVISSEYVMKTPTIEACIAPERQAFLQLNRDRESMQSYPMEKTPFGWTISLAIHEIGLYFYSFHIENVGYIVCGGMEYGILRDHVANAFLLTVYDREYQTPDWFKGGVMYQIFPDRFCKKGTMPDIKGRVCREDWGGEPNFRPNEHGKVLNNDFFGGNFKGIQSKLPYLKKLGITTIYLNPIFKAASNHRYDTSDYMQIDPILGSEEEFSEFIKAAENQGIKVILDGVFNHTGDDSVYFNKYGNYPSVGAYQSKDSPYFSWYSFQEFPNRYSSWWGIDILPEINENSQEYQDFIFEKGGVLKKWLQFGIGGYRLDVADELPDFFLKKLRKSVKEDKPDAIIIGEVWEDASNKIAYSQRREYLQGFELDSVMNYPLKDGIIRYMQTENASELLQTLHALIDHYPKQTLDCLMNILGTHDTARILTVLGGISCQNKEEMASAWAYLDGTAKAQAIEKLKMAVVLQYTLPGVPCVYYGDENGMEGHIDPFCRRCFDWNTLNDPLISFYQSLGKIRKQYRDIFKDGAFEELSVQDGLFYFKRTKEEKEVYVFVNNSSKRYLLETCYHFKDCLTEVVYENEILVKPYSYGIFKKE
ncbi:MAG: glycoside hydrolase family 13 protein [Clostridia bacterium]|nr:glycoside hydrolase family 13 protein [Clostridia bacterium]